MMRVIPIKATDGDRLYREFFAPGFVSERLGTTGHWQGEAAQKLGLTDPVQLDPFTSLLQGRAADGEPLIQHDPLESERTAAWRITLAEAGPASVALWALSPPACRVQLREAHTRAVHGAIEDFARALNGRPWLDNQEAPGRQSALFAEFQGGATREQAPRLHTNLFLFNLRFQKGVQTGSFTPLEVRRHCAQVEAVYTRLFAREVSQIPGPQVQVPAALWRRLDSHPLRGPARRGHHGHHRGVESRQLFGAWQQQARAWGWGPERVRRLILEARSRQTWSNWTQDGRKLLRAWALWVRRPAHSPQRVMSALVRGHEEERSASTQQPSPHSPQPQRQSHSRSH